VGGVALHPKLLTVAIGNADSSTSDTVTLFALASGKMVGVPLVGHAHDVEALAFSPDGEALISSDHEGRIIVWLLPEGRQFVRLGPFSARMFTFSADGSRVAAISASTETIVWGLEPGHWMDRACRMAHRNLTLAEWQQFFGTRPYRETCGLPAAPERNGAGRKGADSSLLRRQ
jgi:WD40 repeat protein